MKATRARIKRMAGCEGKARFETFTLAAQTAHRQAQHKEGRFVAYPCGFCGGFHVGTKFNDHERAVRGFDARQRYAVFACDELGRESLIGFTNDAKGGRVADIITAEPGWMVTRIVDRHWRAAA